MRTVSVLYTGDWVYSSSTVGAQWLLIHSVFDAICQLSLCCYQTAHTKCLYQLTSHKISTSILSWVKVKVIPQQSWASPRGSGSVKAPDFHDVRHYKGGRSSAIRTGRIYSRRYPWYSFSGAESHPGHMVPTEGAKEKIPSDTTRNRSGDQPTSSAVP
jgi:hypothetical protein